MAKKRYKNMSPDLVVAGAQPGEVFEFDYDQPGYDGKALLDAGLIKLVSKPEEKEK